MNTLVPIAYQTERVESPFIERTERPNQAQGFEAEILHFIDQHMPIGREIPVFYCQTGLVDGAPSKVSRWRLYKPRWNI